MVRARGQTEVIREGWEKNGEGYKRGVSYGRVRYTSYGFGEWVTADTTTNKSYSRAVQM